MRELLALVSRLHGTLLDRHRPLWEAHLIEGLDDGRFAIYTKLHHAVMDGISALRLLERSLSTDPDARDGNVKLYAVVQGKPTQIGAQPVAVDPSTWHKLRLVVTVVVREIAERKALGFVRDVVAVTLQQLAHKLPRQAVPINLSGDCEEELIDHVQARLG